MRVSASNWKSLGMESNPDPISTEAATGGLASYASDGNYHDKSPSSFLPQCMCGDNVVIGQSTFSGRCCWFQKNANQSAPPSSPI